MTKKEDRILVLGAFGYDTNKLDGQTVKTRNVYRLLLQHSEGQVDAFDTMHVQTSPFSVLKLLWLLLRCNTLILLPAHNNLTYILPVAYFLSKLVGYSIILICIGGWQIEYFLGEKQFEGHPHPCQLRICKAIKAFLPEMEVENRELIRRLCFTNSEVFPNFRMFDSARQRKENVSDTLKLVYLARVMKQKGYDTIFRFASLVEQNNYNIQVDFYGQIEQEDEDEFLSHVDKHKACVRYLGTLQEEAITDCLTNYDVMLFPTQFYTEGLPGTVLDAYIAGLPVIATEWKHSREFIEDTQTGFIVPFDDCQNAFDEKIITLYKDRQMLAEMKEKAFQRRMQFSPESAWIVLSKYING